MAKKINKNVAHINNTPNCCKQCPEKIPPKHACNVLISCNIYLWHPQNIACTYDAQNAALCICDDAQTYCMHLWDPKPLHAPMMHPKMLHVPMTPKMLHAPIVAQMLLHVPVMPKNTVTCICDDAHTLHAPITNQSVLQAPMMPPNMLLHTPTMPHNCCNMCLWLPKCLMQLLLLKKCCFTWLKK